MALKYTKAQATEINQAWFHLKRFVESNAGHERRIDSCAKIMAKDFGAVAGKAFTLESFLEGLEFATLVLTNNTASTPELLLAQRAQVKQGLFLLANQYNERALVMLSGLHYGNTHGTCASLAPALEKLKEALRRAETAEAEAKQAYIATL